jgi:hypothetical protein
LPTPAFTRFGAHNKGAGLLLISRGRRDRAAWQAQASSAVASWWRRLMLQFFCKHKVRFRAKHRLTTEVSKGAKVQA